MNQQIIEPNAFASPARVQYQEEEFDLDQYLAETYGSLANVLDTVIHGSAGESVEDHIARLRELAAIAEQLSSAEFTLSAGELQAILQKQLRLIEAGYIPNPDATVVGDYMQIVFSDGNVVDLSKAPVRRSMVRFIHQHVKESGNAVFDIHFVSAAYNEQHPDHPWTSVRFKYDLFNRREADFDLLFETLDAPNGRYRLKI